MSSLPEPLQRFKEDAELLLTKLEEVRGTKVLPMLYSMGRFIAKADVDEIYDSLLSIEDRSEVDVILFSQGGDPDQAYLIGNMLQDLVDKKLIVIIPRLVKSAGTLIACAADEVVMLPPSELGPIDPVVESPEKKGVYIPVLSLLESIRSVEALAKMDLGEMRLGIIQSALEKVPITELADYDRLKDHMISLAEKLLVKRMFKNDVETAHKVAEALCTGYKSHSAPITASEAKRLGLKLVNPQKEALDIIWNIHKLWVNNVIEGYESTFPEEANIEALNFKLGKGVVFCIKI